MWKILPLSLLQSVLFASAQVLLKVAMARMPHFAWTKDFWVPLITNWPLLASGISMLAGTLLWMYILRVFPFSIAYPLSSLSYVFGMVAALIFFGEAIPVSRWIGVAMILTGCFFVSR